MFSNRFDVLCQKLKKLKNIILMHFQTKNTLNRTTITTVFNTNSSNVSRKMTTIIALRHVNHKR